MNYIINNYNIVIVTDSRYYDDYCYK